MSTRGARGVRCVGKGLCFCGVSPSLGPTPTSPACASSHSSRMYRYCTSAAVRSLSFGIEMNASQTVHLPRSSMRPSVRRMIEQGCPFRPFDCNPALLPIVPANLRATSEGNQSHSVTARIALLRWIGARFRLLPIGLRFTLDALTCFASQPNMLATCQRPSRS